jgi:hypothetical protein
MIQVDRPVEHRHADAQVTPRLPPEIRDARDHRDLCHQILD